MRYKPKKNTTTELGAIKMPKLLSKKIKRDDINT